MSRNSERWSKMSCRIKNLWNINSKELIRWKQLWRMASNVPVKKQSPRTFKLKEPKMQTASENVSLKSWKLDEKLVNTGGTFWELYVCFWGRRREQRASGCCEPDDPKFVLCSWGTVLIFRRATGVHQHTVRQSHIQRLCRGGNQREGFRFISKKGGWRAQQTDEMKERLSLRPQVEYMINNSKDCSNYWMSCCSPLEKV